MTTSGTRWTASLFFAVVVCAAVTVGWSKPDAQATMETPTACKTSQTPVALGGDPGGHAKTANSATVGIIYLASTRQPSVRDIITAQSHGGNGYKAAPA